MKRSAIIVALVVALTGCAPKTEGGTAVPPTVKEARSGYQLQFGKDFNRGMNSVDAIGISVAITVDVSGSMDNEPMEGGKPKYVQATESLRSVLTYIGELAKKQPDLVINVAVSKFSNDVKIVVPLTRVTESSIASILGVCTVQTFAPTGGTAIGRALNASCKTLAQSGTIMNSLIVISDGANTVGVEPEDVLLGMTSNNNDAYTEDQDIYTNNQLVSFIGFDVNYSTFEGFKKYGARVIAARDRVELESSLKAILEADITKLEG